MKSYDPGYYKLKNLAGSYPIKILCGSILLQASASGLPGKRPPLHVLTVVKSKPNWEFFEVVLLHALRPSEVEDGLN